MAEKSTRISEGADGEYLATRDAYENDDGANARTIQINDEAFRNHVITIGTTVATRTLMGIGLPTGDGGQVDAFPAEFFSSALTVGDKTKLIVATRFTAKSMSTTPTIVITPILLDGNDIALASLESFVISSVVPMSGMTAPIHNVMDMFYNWMICPMLSWNVEGAIKIGIHVESNGFDGSMEDCVEVFAAMITGPPIDSDRIVNDMGAAFGSVIIPTSLS